MSEIYPAPMCCPDKSYRIIFAHGTNAGRSQFMLPKNTNVITLSLLGKPIDLNKLLDNYIIDFYKSGHFIFANKDKSYNLSKDGRPFIQRLRKIFDLEIRNHVGRIKMNDQILNFNCPIEICNLYCNRVCKPMYYTLDGYQPVKTILLSDLIDKEGYGASYILIACRNFGECATSQLKEHARKVSFDIPITDYNEYESDE